MDRSIRGLQDATGIQKALPSEHTQVATNQPSDRHTARLWDDGNAGPDPWKPCSVPAMYHPVLERWYCIVRGYRWDGKLALHSQDFFLERRFGKCWLLALHPARILCLLGIESNHPPARRLIFHPCIEDLGRWLAVPVFKRNPMRHMDGLRPRRRNERARASKNVPRLHPWEIIA